MYGYRADQRKLSKLMGIDYLWFGLFGQIAGLILMACAAGASSFQPMMAGEFVVILMTGVLIGGCAKYARFHGMSRWWSLLGVFSVPGVLILKTLPVLWREKHRGAGFSVIFAEPYRRDVWRMDVKVTLDETTRAGVREPIMLQMPRGARVGTAMKMLSGVISGLSDEDFPGVRYRVNGQPVDRRTELSNGDELVVDVARDEAGTTG
jgi:hypothetical protein